MQLNNNRYPTFQSAFIGNIRNIWDSTQYSLSSRIGDVLEVQSLCYQVNDVHSFIFKNEDVGRIPYDYCKTFYEWMISGSSDVEDIVKQYPNISRFVEKPKSKELPDNFNTFYGPRILKQLPHILKELEINPDSRRAVISILNEDDLNLLDKDETLEFPCCDSASFTIRDNKLNLHLHMRSQNMAQVAKLDMYLWGRFQLEVAEKLKIEAGLFTSSIVSAHIFLKDVEYLKSINIII